MTSDSLVHQAVLFYEAGSIARLNLLQLQAQYAGDKFLLVQTENTIKQDMLLLKELLQLPTDTLLDIIRPDSLSVTKYLLPLYQVQLNALQSFPEIKNAQLGIEVAKLGISKARAGFFPTISATGAIGTGYSNFISNANDAQSPWKQQAANNFYQRLTLTAIIPVFIGRLNQTNLEKAKIGWRQANYNAGNTTLILSQAVEQAYLNTSNAIHAYDAAREELVAAKESFRITNEQFRLGAANTFQVLQLRNLYVQAIQAFTQTRYTAIFQYKMYEFYMGKPITL